MAEQKSLVFKFVSVRAPELAEEANSAEFAVSSDADVPFVERLREEPNGV